RRDAHPAGQVRHVLSLARRRHRAGDRRPGSRALRLLHGERADGAAQRRRGKLDRAGNARTDAPCLQRRDAPAAARAPGGRSRPRLRRLLLDRPRRRGEGGLAPAPARGKLDRQPEPRPGRAAAAREARSQPFVTAEAPTTAPVASSACTCTKRAGAAGSAIAVSKPAPGAPPTGLSAFAAGPARTRQPATTVAPFQLA